MKQLLIYERPLQLNRAAHRHYRLQAEEGDFRFAAAINSAPLAAVEFAHAATCYPILFAGPSAEAVVPAALLGLRPGQNLFVDAEGKWADDDYVPAFLRRYPFVLAEKSEGSDEFTVCLDSAFPGLVEGGDKGEPLFDEQGQDSPLLSNALNFLKEYQGQTARTRALVQALNAHQLLIPQQINVQPAGDPPFSLDGFFVVDERKLRTLKGKALQELVQSGDLGSIYVHLMSLVNVERLTRRLPPLAAPTRN